MNGPDPHEVGGRELMLALGAEGPLGGALGAQTREHEAAELAHLVEVAERRPCKEVNDRIAKILSDMEKRNAQADNVVHPELLRGHPVGNDAEDQRDAVARVRPDANGAEGNGAAPNEGAPLAVVGGGG